jgi:RNA polymerase sigma factor (sigma-70 family)
MTSLMQVLDQIESAGGLTDGQLLARFVATRDEPSFAALVRRHGPMVLGVCRRVLGNVQDAEDAFQATFFVLANKASSVARRESVGSWLYGVAYHTSLRAAATIAFRRKKERQVDNVPHPAVAPDESKDWLPLLDRELNCLPEKYRAAIVLCELEGKTRREAAGLLGVPEGTLSSRLAVGRRMLAKRLARAGLTLAGAAAAGSRVPSALAVSVVRTACGQPAASAAAVLLVNEVMKAMLMKKLRLAVGGVLVVVALGVVGLGYQAGNNPAVAQAARPNELEALRKEVELLRLNLLVVLEKVRAQEAELRESRSKRVSEAPAEGGISGMMRRGLGAGTGFSGGNGIPGGGPGTRFDGGTNSNDGLSGTLGNRTGSSSGAPAPGTPAATSDPVKEAEEAVKALREAKDKDGKRKATEALERAMKKLKEKPWSEPIGGSN